MYFFYFYPLGLDRRTLCYPLVTRLLTTVMLVAFAWFHYRPEWTSVDPWTLIFYPGNGAPWTALTALFLHGGWFHLIGNLLYLNVFGPPLEGRLGSGLFLVVFLLGGTFGNLVHGIVSAWGLLGSQGTGVLGVSGALAGLLSFSLVRFYNAQVEIAWWVFAPLVGQNKTGKTHVPIVFAVVLWFALQVVHALVAAEAQSRVSYGAHLGGFFMGFVLAMILGQLRDGRIESRLILAEKYFQQGEYFAAVGAWTEYLEMVPGELVGLLGRARARRLINQASQARRDYQRALDCLLKSRQADDALEVYREVHRAGLSSSLPASQLGRLGTLMEKQLDYEGALAAYRELHEGYPKHTAGRRALVRLVHLYHGKVADKKEAARWLQVACRTLPGGDWREYLTREFSGEAELCADAPAARAVFPPTK